MNYLPMMTDDEIKYVCSVIHPQSVSSYFQRHPKSFAKIFPGFRPNAMHRFNIADLLFKYHNRGFISSFIEDHINHWLPEIQEHIDQCMDEGDSKDAAYIKILPQSFFAGNVTLYFKLIEEEHHEAYLSLLSAAVVEAKRVSEELDALKADGVAKDKDIERLQSELQDVAIALEKSKVKQNEYAVDIKALKQGVSETEELNRVILDKDKVIIGLKAEVKSLKKSEKELNIALTEIRSNQQQLEAQIREELETQQTEKAKKQTEALKPLRPIDLDEFKEYLGYNLKDIGATTPSDGLFLLKHLLCDILFQGIPIIINRGTGESLMKCVTNALVGSKNVSALTYSNDVSTQEIESFLSSDERVVHLDNFIGNYNETELLSVLQQHRNKIIFLTLPYDRTLRYIPYEFFRYCNYLNLNRIPALLTNANLTEDPSECDEVAAETPELCPDTRYSPLLGEILCELGLSPSLMMHKLARISNEQDLCSVLTFDILPYCVDVLQIAPFAASERLSKYAGDMGRCAYKNLLKEWFT